MIDGPRVLFVSKPIVPPWHDGSKNLVRDVAEHLVRARPTVLTTPGASTLDGRVACEAVYTDAGRFAPSLTANARVVRRLLTGDPQDVWHFVFAPNPASSTAARFARRVRRAGGWKGSVVQTIASAPRSFEGVARWIFGDSVIALSEWTRGRLMGAGVKRQVRVIPPCAAAPRAPTDDEKRAARAKYDLGDGPLVLYPGDYEVSRGAATVARAVAAITRDVPGARVVFACRAKTSRAGEVAEALKADLRAAGLLDRTRHVGEVSEMAPLMACASVVLFPVDDLYGKVDLPLVLLEALALGLPLVLARGGPLEAISSARFVEPDDDAALAAECAALLRDPAAARAQASSGRSLYERSFTPRVVAAKYDDLYSELGRGEHGEEGRPSAPA